MDGAETSLHVQRKRAISLTEIFFLRNISACAEKTVEHIGRYRVQEETSLHVQRKPRLRRVRKL